MAHDSARIGQMNGDELLPASPTKSDPATRLEEAVHRFQLGYELQMAGELEQAIACYQRSVDLYPTAEAHTFLGWTSSFQDRYQETIEECRRAIAVDPDFGNPYNDIGAYLIELGKFEEAIPWFRRAMTAQCYDARGVPCFNLGRVYERLGRWGEASEAYEQALQADPDYTLAREALTQLRALCN